MTFKDVFLFRHLKEWNVNEFQISQLDFKQNSSIIRNIRFFTVLLGGASSFEIPRLVNLEQLCMYIIFVK